MKFSAVLALGLLGAAFATEQAPVGDGTPPVGSMEEKTEKTETPEVIVHELPELPYEYTDLEPHISGEIMELHHKVHHQAYVTALNIALKATNNVMKRSDTNAVEMILKLSESIRFNGGGHINHSLFWVGLAKPGTEETEPRGLIKEAIMKYWGSMETFDAAWKYNLMSIRGSGWGWLVCNVHTKQIYFRQTENQDIVQLPEVVLLGVDMWEHAYYLQYYANKSAYINAIAHVLNWEAADERYAKCFDAGRR